MITENDEYTKENNILFSKDKSTLILYPAELKAECYTVPDGVVTIGDEAVSNSFLKKIILPRGLKEIIQYGFACCKNLEEIYIPRSLEKVLLKAFMWDEKLRDVYYEGTKEEWDRILIAEFNESLTGARVHFDFSYRR